MQELIIIQSFWINKTILINTGIHKLYKIYVLRVNKHCEHINILQKRYRCLNHEKIMYIETFEPNFSNLPSIREAQPPKQRERDKTKKKNFTQILSSKFILSF